MHKAALLAGAALLCAVTADAQVPLDSDQTSGLQALTCAPVDVLAALARRDFGERRIGHGVSQTGQLVKLLASPDGATWSMLIVWPDGHACLLDAGEAWQIAAIGAPS